MKAQAGRTAGKPTTKRAITAMGKNMKKSAAKNAQKIYGSSKKRGR